jgi:uncharacterized membrane protein
MTLWPVNTHNSVDCLLVTLSECFICACRFICFLYGSCLPVNITYTERPVNITYAERPVNITYTECPVNITYTESPVNITYTERLVNITYTERPVNITYTEHPCCVLKALTCYKNLSRTETRLILILVVAPVFALQTEDAYLWVCNLSEDVRALVYHEM